MNSPNRAIRRSRAPIVSGRRNRADCCRAHPSLIASITADAGSRWITLRANTRCADPGCSVLTGMLYQMQQCCRDAVRAGQRGIDASADSHGLVCDQRERRSGDRAQMLHRMQFILFVLQNVRPVALSAPPHSAHSTSMRLAISSWG